jgi:Tol biopolymer transport system component
LAEGEYIAYAIADRVDDDHPILSLFLVSPDGIKAGPLADEVYAGAPSPDTAELALVRADGLHVLHAEGGGGIVDTEYPLLSSPYACDQPYWSPAGDSFILHCDGPLQEESVLLYNRGTLNRIADAQACFAFSWSPDGLRFAAACHEGLGSLRVFSIDAGDNASIPGCGSDFTCNRPSWSPTGQFIAFFRGLGRSGVPTPGSGYYIIGVDCLDTGHDCVEAATTPLLLGDNLTWSPDGARIAFAENNTNALLISAVPSSQAHQVYTFREPPDSLKWSPGGRWLAFSLDTMLYAFDIATGDTYPLANGDLLSLLGWVKISK